MASCSLCSLRFSLTILSIFLAVALSDDGNADYIACSIPFSCGGLQNVTYPFWGDNRPKFCGIPDLRLSCFTGDGKNHPYPRIHNVFLETVALAVHSINSSSHTMVLNESTLFESCFVYHQQHLTLNPALKPAATNEEKIQLFYGCTNSCTSKYHFSCNNNSFDGTDGTIHYFDASSDKHNKSGKSCSCKYNQTFPVNKRVLDELKSTTTTTTNLSNVLNKWPIIMMEYKANFTACSKCEQSGGRCGSTKDETSAFACYCPDGSYNNLVCPLAPSVHKNKNKLAIASCVGGVFVLVAIIATCLCKKHKLGPFKHISRSASFDCSASELEKGSIYFGVPLFPYRELVEATNNFDQSEELGNGGFGIVYHGWLKDGREVAVKRLYEKNYKRIEQFMNEIYILTRLRHHNLVSLYGCTSQHCRELLLVYEYVNNGTVADHLFSRNTTSRLSPLSWPVRLRIAIETAAALSYLHASDIIHRDVKTNNILLDSNFSVKVADFGLSRLFPTDVTHVSTAPQGTPGYVDPEYHQCYQLTDKSDVYSFGVVLVELISSLPAIDMDRHRNEINLSNYAINRIRQCAFEELVDPQLGFATDFKVRRMTISVAELAFQCLQHDKEFRPSMDEVLEVLKKIEGADYEALLQAEEISEKAEEEVKLHCSNLPPPPSPTENDHEQLLRNHQPHPPSPVSVIGKWTSRSTSSSNSK